MHNWFFPIAISLPLAAPAAPPSRVEVAYEVARNGAAVAEVIDRLEHDGRAYRLEESWKGKGVFALRGEAQRSSRGTVAGRELRPLEFEDRRSGRPAARVQFGWDAKTLTLQYKGGPETRPLPPGAQDRLSFLWSFSFDPPRGEVVTLNVADGKGVSTQVYQPAGRERIRTPAGAFDALKLAKKKDRADERGTELWLAADRHFVPVRILVTEKDGTRIEQIAVRIAAP
jgi:hypothetical protein